jgi:hypothetical protein
VYKLCRVLLVLFVSWYFFYVSSKTKKKHISFHLANAKDWAACQGTTQNLDKMSGEGVWWGGRGFVEHCWPQKLWFPLFLQTFIRSSFGLPYYGKYITIIQEIKETTDLIGTTSFRHERSASNGEAHWLARSYLDRENGCQVWLLQPPEGFCIPLNIVINQ